MAMKRLDDSSSIAALSSDQSSTQRSRSWGELIEPTRCSNLLKSGSTWAQLPRSALGGTNLRGEWTGKLLNGSKLIGVSRRFERAKSNEMTGRLQPVVRKKNEEIRYLRR